MDILKYCKNHTLILDGGMGSLLMNAGMKPGENTASWTLSHPDVIRHIHEEYYRAGANAVITDTFAANTSHYGQDELEKIISAACTLARQARDTAAEQARQAGDTAAGQARQAREEVTKQASDGEPERDPDGFFWGFDIGPLGEMLEPFGDMEYGEAVDAFAVSVRAAEKCEPDFYFIETMNDKAQTLAALQAVKENSNRPVFVSNTYDERGCLFTGASPQEMIEALEAGGADAIGINCSFGPKGLLPILSTYLERAKVPVFFKPNAGMPRIRDGQTVYDMTPEEFAREIGEALDLGLRIVGGCCGTTPEFIAAAAKLLTARGDEEKR